MACGSTCCAPPKALPAVIHPSTPPLLNNDAVDSTIAREDACCQIQPDTEVKICSTGSASNILENDDCCSSESVDVEPQDLKQPSCCEGKVSPCCDSSCIDRIALRECATDGKSQLTRGLQSATDPTLFSLYRGCNLRLHPQKYQDAVSTTPRKRPE